MGLPWPCLPESGIEGENAGLADSVAIDLPQIEQCLFHRLAAEANVVDGDELLFLADKLPVLLLIHGLDGVPVGIEDLGRVLELVEHAVEQLFVPLLVADHLDHHLVEVIVEAIVILGKAALDKGHYQGQEVIAQTGALDDQGGEGDVGRRTYDQGITLESGIGKEPVEV